MYCCGFPGCNYTVLERSLIERHHITPIELGGCDADYNLIYLCPNHHKLIHIPNCNFGIHSISHNDSIVILKIYKSTIGRILEYYNVLDRKVTMVEIEKRIL